MITIAKYALAFTSVAIAILSGVASQENENNYASAYLVVSLVLMTIAINLP